MIISASYKTDIPTFYGEWLINRLRAGYCKMVNPYGRQIYTIDLSPEKVDGIVFWTKNIGPFVKHLPEVQERGFPFVIQHTINGYPRELEARVIDYERTIEHMRCLAGEYGPERLIWRYDPIIFSSLTDYSWHQQNFEKLAMSLKGTTDEVIISFAQLYAKTKRNMDNAAREHNFSWDTHKAGEESFLELGCRLATELAQIAKEQGMQVKICSQEKFLQALGVVEARCIDAKRLERISGCSIMDKKQKGNREECGCSASKDIGEYDTCPHGCVYCYAVRNRELALTRYQHHEPSSEFLFPPKDYITEEDDMLHPLTVITHSEQRQKQGGKSCTKEKNVSEQQFTLWPDE
jgi:hypothetical protein